MEKETSVTLIKCHALCTVNDDTPLPLCLTPCQFGILTPDLGVSPLFSKGKYFQKWANDLGAQAPSLLSEALHPFDGMHFTQAFNRSVIQTWSETNTTMGSLNLNQTLSGGAHQPSKRAEAHCNTYFGLSELPDPVPRFQSTAQPYPASSLAFN